MSGVREFRASADVYRVLLRSPARVAALLLVAVWLAVLVAQGGPGVPVYLGVAVVAVVLGSRRATGRIRVDERSLSVRGGVVRARTVPFADVGSVLLLPRFHEVGDPPSGLLVVLDAARRPLLRLEGDAWGRDTLREVAAALPLPVTTLDDDLTPSGLVWRRLYELPWHERHRVLTEGAVLLAVAAVVVAVLVATG